jgi:hypothetical protein
LGGKPKYFNQYIREVATTFWRLKNMEAYTKHKMDEALPHGFENDPTRSRVYQVCPVCPSDDNMIMAYGI